MPASFRFTILVTFVTLVSSDNLPPEKTMEYHLVPPALTYNKTSQLIFSLGPPACPRESFKMTQVTMTGKYVDWGYTSPGASFYNESTFTISNASFLEWGSYTAQCLAASPGFFVYQPFPLSIPVPVNPRILHVNFTRLEDEFAPTTTTTLKPENVTTPNLPDPVDENTSTAFEFPIPLPSNKGVPVQNWLLKFDVGDGFYPNGERGQFDLSGLEMLTPLTSSNYNNQIPFDVPYENFPDGTSYRFTFALTADAAASKAPSVCDFPLIASVAMPSNKAASLHSYNVTLKLKYQAQEPRVSARMEGDGNCVISCSIKSACPLLKSLKLQFQTPSGGKQVPSVSTERSTVVEVRLTQQDCDAIAAMAKNNTGLLKCTARNEVGMLSYDLQLKDVPGIMSLERRVSIIPGAGLPFWAKITIPVACLLVLILFIAVIILCVQKCKLARRRRQSAAITAAAAADNRQNENIQHQSQTQLQTMAVPPTLSSSRENINNPAPTRNNGEYRGPVSTQGQTYQMPQPENVTDYMDDDPPESRARPSPAPAPTRPWQGGFSYTSAAPRQPTSAAPPLAAASPGNVQQQQPQARPPIGYAQPYRNTPPSSSGGVQREESYAQATRQAAARYLPPGTNSPSDSPVLSRKNAPTESGKNSGNTTAKTGGWPNPNSGGVVV